MIKIGEVYSDSKVHVGDQLYFKGQKRPYKVRASNAWFAICTKPHFKTVLYTIVDFHEQIRGTENLVFGMGAEDDTDCQEMLERLTQGETEVSHRNRTKLDIVKWVDNFNNQQ